MQQFWFMLALLTLVGSLHLRPATGQPFTEVQPPLPDAAHSALALGDYDSDGYLDVVLAGRDKDNDFTRLFRNDKGTRFTSVEAQFVGVTDGDLQWADYDRDGDLDLLVTGHDFYYDHGGAVQATVLYRNDGAGSFQQITTSLPALSQSTADWGDYDEDGDFDLVLAGSDWTTEVFRNDGADVFTPVLAGLEPRYAARTEWGDYDADGDLDLLSAGWGGDVLIYRNDGADHFESLLTPFPRIYAGTASWVDIDRDGDLDVFLMGALAEGPRNPTTRIYRNDDGVFHELSLALPGLFHADAAWGDLNGDGYPDLVLTGSTGEGSPMAAVFLGYGSDVFLQQDAALKGVQDGAVTLGDYDRDGDLDLFLTGNDRGGPVTRLYRNDRSSTPPRPQPPTLLSAAVEQGTATLRWQAPPETAYTYNLRVGTAPGADDVLSAMARPDGTRLVARPGNAGQTPFYHLRHLPNGTYYWRVQAIDGRSVGSAFSPEATFTVTNSDVEHPFQPLSTGLPGLEGGALDWGDYDADGDLDLLLQGSLTEDGEPQGTGTRLYRQDGSLHFSEESLTLPRGYLNHVAWADYDGDGDLDAAIGGHSSSFYPDPGLFANDGDGAFSRLDVPLEVDEARGQWWDYDQDGDLDVLWSNFGYNEGRESIARLYQNTGRGQFAATPITFPYARFQIGDLNGDGWPDLVADGRWWYQNDGFGAFTQFDAYHLLGFSPRTDRVALVDYDGDGDLDLHLIMASHAPLYTNEGGWTFSRASFVFPGTEEGTAHWADFNTDGLPDVLITEVGTERGVRLFKNIGGGRFVEMHGAFDAFWESAAAWADVDDDGDLDVLLAGRTGNTARSTLYLSAATRPNTPPAALSGLRSEVEGNKVTLGWTAGTDAETPSTGLSYNLRVGTTPGASDVMSPMALPSGERLVTGPGNAGRSPAFVVHNLKQGTYYWTVQAIDTGFAGSPFAEEGTFTVEVGVTAPLNLQARPGFRQATLTWEAGPLATQGYYRIYARTEHAPEAVIDSVDIHQTSHLIEDLEHGVTYTFRMTAVDAAGHESSFSNEVVVTPFVLNDYGLRLPNGKTTWGDCDADGDLDVLLTSVLAESHDNYATLLFQYDEDRFVPAAATFPALYDGVAYWTDADNDNDLDLLLSGRITEPSARSVTHLYLNDGTCTFSAPYPITEDTVFTQATFGDYDNDGDLDLLASGWIPAPFTRLFANDGTGAFSQVEVGLPANRQSRPLWGDYDRDGDLDVLMIILDKTNSAPAATVLYRNEGAGAFTEAQRWESFDIAAEWHDYDGDSDLDLILAGGGDHNRSVRYYRNDGAGGFSLVDAGLPTGYETMSSDYDGDGDLDVLIEAYAATMSAPAWRIYVNDGTGLFQRHPSNPAFDGEHPRWIDYDADGDLDLAFSESRLDEQGIAFTRIFQNEKNASPAPPLAPRNLSAEVFGTAVTLQWQAPPGASRATYNLRVGTTLGGSDVVSGMAVPSGRRLLPAEGNVQHSTAWTLNELIPNHTYYWSVQAISPALVGSPFAEAGTFTIGTRVAFALHGNYPSPANEATTLVYDLPADALVSVAVYNVLGQKVLDLPARPQDMGYERDFTIRVDALAAGVYVYRVTARVATGIHTKTGTLIVLR